MLLICSTPFQYINAYETAQALVKVYGFWGDRNRITITEKPTGEVSIIDMKPFSRELVENLLETTLKDMGLKVAVEIMEGRHDDLLMQGEVKCTCISPAAEVQLEVVRHREVTL